MTARARRFALLRHDVKPGDTHWDLVIEGAPEGKLFTWRLAGPLPARVGERVAGERSFDHRAIYLVYEGEISGGRGRVTREAGGVLEDVRGDPAAPGGYVFHDGELLFEIDRDGVLKLA